MRQQQRPPCCDKRQSKQEKEACVVGVCFFVRSFFFVSVCLFVLFVLFVCFVDTGDEKHKHLGWRGGGVTARAQQQLVVVVRGFCCSWVVRCRCDKETDRDGRRSVTRAQLGLLMACLLSRSNRLLVRLFARTFRLLKPCSSRLLVIGCSLGRFDKRYRSERESAGASLA